MSVKLNIKANVPVGVIDAYNAALKSVDEFDLYGISEGDFGDCIRDVIVDTAESGSDDFMITAEFLKRELEWNLLEKLSTMAREAEFEYEISPQKCSALLRKYKALNNKFRAVVDAAPEGETWNVGEIETDR